jgi:hypothetical protein
MKLKFKHVDIHAFIIAEYELLFWTLVNLKDKKEMKEF